MEQMPVLGNERPKLLDIPGWQMRLNFMATLLCQIPAAWKDKLPTPPDGMGTYDKYKFLEDESWKIIDQYLHDRKYDHAKYEQMILQSSRDLNKGPSSHQLLQLGIETQDEQRRQAGNSFLKTHRLDGSTLPGRPAA